MTMGLEVANKMHSGYQRTEGPLFRIKNKDYYYEESLFRIGNYGRYSEGSLFRNHMKGRYEPVDGYLEFVIVI